MDKEEQEQVEEQPKVDTRLPVRLVAHKDGSALVEWIDDDGLYHRVYVPLGKLKDGTVSVKDLGKGIPHGLPWEDWIEIEVTPESIANELRRRGIWCWPDITNSALDAVNRAFDKGAFLRRVDKEVK